MKEIDWFEIKYAILTWEPIEKIINIYNRIIDGSVNIFKWFQIVWKDRDFDYNYLDKIILFKLKKMEKYFRNEPHIIEKWEKVANEIKEAIDCLERSMKCEYVDKHNNIDFETKKEIIDGKVFYKWIDNRTKEEKENDWNMIIKVKEMQETDRQRAFDIISKYGPGWWD